MQNQDTHIAAERGIRMQQAHDRRKGVHIKMHALLLYDA